MSYGPVNRAIDVEPITVYEPGSRSRNVIHVVDAARAFMDSPERLEEQLVVCETGVTTSPIASDEDQSFGAIAETIRQIAMAGDLESAVEVLENPLRGETMVGWSPSTSPARPRRWAGTPTKRHRTDRAQDRRPGHDESGDGALSSFRRQREVAVHTGTVLRSAAAL
jgi:nucleoside-diphosphate-sugar epimerase